MVQRKKRKKTVKGAPYQTSGFYGIREQRNKGRGQSKGEGGEKKHSGRAKFELTERKSRMEAELVHARK